MLGFMDLMTVIGLVLLRFGVPLAIVAVAGYFLKQLDARWEAELGASAEAEAREAEQPAIAPALPARPTAPAQRRREPAPGPLPTFVPPPAISPSRQQGLQPGMAMAPAQPCWDVKGCTEEAKASCAAPQHPGTPCWQARLDAEGKIPETCVECDVFQRYPTM
jgi:hypothetical protein